jgi:type IV secretion system protein TrbL
VNVAREGASALGQKVTSGAKALKDKVTGPASHEQPTDAGASPAVASPDSINPSSPPAEAPGWAKRMQRSQH